MNGSHISSVGEFRGKESVPGMLKVGTLEQLHTDASERVLNCLNLPMSSHNIVGTPGLRHVSLLSIKCPTLTTAHSELSSDRWTWSQTRGNAGFRPIGYPLDIMNWATVATRGATSWVHSDTDGLGTVTQLLTGAKYWTMFTRNRSLLPHETNGDLGAIDFAPPLAKFQDHELDGWLTAEAILLGPRDVLYVVFADRH
jgi:hypothetical protein